MTRLSRLLVASDLSARSDRAVERAVALAYEHQAKLDVLHIVDEDLPAMMAQRVEDAAEQLMREHLAAIVAAGQIDVTVAVRVGRGYEAILNEADASDAELVVLGAHREDAFKDRFRGTTVERVTRFGDRPVLLVRDRARAQYRRVLAGVDFSVCSRRAVEFANRLVLAGEFHLVHAYQVPFKGFLYGADTHGQVSRQHEEQLKRTVMEEFAAFQRIAGSTDSRADLILREGDPQRVLRTEIDRLAPDLLVVGTHGRTGVARALLGSVAEALLREPPCDVLAVKAW